MMLGSLNEHHMKTNDDKYDIHKKDGSSDNHLGQAGNKEDCVDGIDKVKIQINGHSERED